MKLYRLAPPAQNFLAEAPTLQVSLLIPARQANSLANTVKEAHSFLSREFHRDYEIILIPNSAREDASDPTLKMAEELSKESSHVRVHRHLSFPGKGAALRTGLEHARGRWIFFTDADLPYDLEFFSRAASELKKGAGLVTGNRRLSESHFDVPVDLLNVAYSRHRLGLAFNRVVRAILPVQTTDTQAGIKAMTRELAREGFIRMECPGFFFDVELFLAAKGLGYPNVELPVMLHLNSEKTTVKLIREGILATYWLSRIFKKHCQGVYQRHKESPG